MIMRFSLSRLVTSRQMTSEVARARANFSQSISPGVELYLSVIGDCKRLLIVPTRVARTTFCVMSVHDGWALIQVRGSYAWRCGLPSPDHAFGSIATEMRRPRHVWFPLDSDR